MCAGSLRMEVFRLGEGLRKVYLPVTGMSCAACARRVEKVLSGTEGVYGASVNLAADKAAVEYDPASADPDGLIRAVEEAGYGVEKSKADFGVTGMSCAACVGRVEKALLRVPGVLEVNVNLAAEKATVERLAGTSGVADLERAVEGAGYGVVGVGEEGPAEDARERRGVVDPDHAVAGILDRPLQIRHPGGTRQTLD